MALKVLKNSEIAEEYGVFRGSVGKWVKSALNQENKLQLQEINSKWFVIDNTHNRSELQNLKQRSLKFRNRLDYERVIVDPKLYDIFDYGNLVELITKLEDDKIIPLKFSYLNGGADIWSDFVNSTFDSDKYFAAEGNKLLNESFDYLTDKLKPYDTVNIVDVGPGNGLSLKPLIDEFLSKKFKVNYSAIDISSRMLEIVKTNINSWYPKVKVDTEIGDMDYMVIREKLFSNKLTNKNSCNIILFLGYTIGNVYDSHRVFRNFYDSLSQDDFFIVNNGLDLPQLRTSFNTLEMTWSKKIVSWIPNMLGIKEGMYDRINKYDEISKRRVQVIKLKKDLDIEFNIKNHSKIIQFKDGDEITVWNHFSHTLDNLIKEIRDVDLGISYMTRSPDKSEALLICEVDK
jgi:SAM-dependent methyltransferase